MTSIPLPIEIPVSTLIPPIVHPRLPKHKITNPKGPDLRPGHLAQLVVYQYSGSGRF